MLLALVKVAASDFYSLPQFNLRSWDQDDGLPSTRINAVASTPDGYLWLATFGGLARFDGVSFVVFNANNAPALDGSLITALDVDRNGRLLVGTAAGRAALLERGKFSPILLPSEAVGKRINAICNDTNGTIWFAVQSVGIISLHNANLRVYGKADGLNVLNPTALAYDGAGKLWAISGGDFYEFRDGRWSSPQVAAITPSSMAALAPASDGGLWLATVASSSRSVRILKRQAGGEIKELSPGPWPQETARSRIESLLEDKSGRLWCATAGNGVYCYSEAGGWQLIGANTSLARTDVISLFSDAAGTIWIGTRTGGLHRARPSLVTTLRLPANADHNLINSVCARRDGSIWAGTDGAGIFCWQGTNNFHFGAAQGLLSPEVLALLEDAKSNLYAATAGGLFELVGEKFVPVAISGLVSDVCRCLMTDRQNYLWIGTRHGVVRSGETNSDLFGAGRRPFFARELMADKAGQIFAIGYGGGLYQLDGKDFTRPKLSAKVNLSTARCAEFDRDGDLWIGSEGEALMCRQGEQIFEWTYQDDHLPSNHHFALLEDGGMVWVSSENGIFGCPVPAFKQYVRSANSPFAVWRLTVADGLAEKVCSSGGQPAASRSVDGWLWFPDGPAVVGFDPKKVVKKMSVAAPLLESILVDGGSVDLPADRKLELNSGAERFEFHFTSPNTVAPERLRFRYQLVGMDSVLVNVANRRVAYYTHLPPGEYQFKLQVSGPDDSWQNQAVDLKIRIIPRFWERESVRVAVVFLILMFMAVVAWGIERGRSRRRLERMEMQRKLDSERQRIARDIHDDLGSGLTEIIMLSDIAGLEEKFASTDTSQVKKISARARSLTRAMDEVVWAINPRNDSLESFLTYLNRWAQSYLNHAKIRCRWDIPMDIPDVPLPADMRHHLFLACKEALNNAVKYANATEIWIRCELTGGRLSLSVEDNGIGFLADIPTERGNGLKNMRQRLEELRGECEINSSVAQGTTIQFRVPLTVGKPTH